jgi:hypothetical protein
LAISFALGHGAWRSLAGVVPIPVEIEVATAARTGERATPA